ncbi:MAG: PD40 domain-containing protein [Proteobacteria bacterium]|jgi:TolB protein|nr:PD40 domain-containing protein [Pseudomonadota bacterium]
MKKIFCCLAALTMGLSCSVAIAQTPQPVNDTAFTVQVASQRMALAVAPVSGAGGATAAIDKMLNHTLKLTGLFDMVPVGSFLPGLATESHASTNYDGWFSSGAQVVIKSEVKLNGNALVLDFGLYDAHEKRRIPLDYGNQNATVDKYSAPVYAFVNAVVQYFTGEPGFFGQSMLAVTREGKGKGARVVTMMTDGNGISRVTRSSAIEMLPSWGPSGSVLLTSYAKGNPDLYSVVNGAGRRISSHLGMNSGAKYCAGSGKIALTLSKDGDAEIYTMNADGSGLKRLTTNRAIDTSPVWSPDCSRIAFVSDRGGNPQIYTMNADGSGVSRLTVVGNYNTNPAWSKKNQIAFSARDEQHSLDIFVINADGSDLTRITQQQGKNDSPTWSPDGRYLAFSSTRDGGSRIYISTADGKSQAAATTSGWYENPVWGR